MSLRVLFAVLSRILSCLWVLAAGVTWRLLYEVASLPTISIDPRNWYALITRLWTPESHRDVSNKSTLREHDIDEGAMK